MNVSKTMLDKVAARAKNEGKQIWARVMCNDATGRVVTIDDDYVGVQTRKGEMCVTLDEVEFLILTDEGSDNEESDYDESDDD